MPASPPRAFFGQDLRRRRRERPKPQRDEAFTFDEYAGDAREEAAAALGVAAGNLHALRRAHDA